MKGPDWAAVIAQIRTEVTTYGPYAMTVGALVGGVWNRWRWLSQKLRLGTSQAQLARELAEAETQFARSERARSSLRVMVDDLQRSYDKLEEDFKEARERLAEINAIFEIRTANEYMLFQDREKIKAWGECMAVQLAVLGGVAPPEPELMGIPAAEPDEVVIERFMRERSDLLKRFGTGINPVA